MRDQVDLLAVGAIDRAEYALAEPRGVLDDPFEHRKRSVGASAIRLNTSAAAA